MAAASRTDAGSSATTARGLVARELAAPEEASERPAFTVRRTTAPPRRRPGDRDRDPHRASRAAGSSCSPTATRPASPGCPAPRRCSSSGACSRRATCDKTLVLVSTTGATTGFAGARAWARERGRRAVDGVIVLGDMAGDADPQAVGRVLAGVVATRCRSASSARCRPRVRRETRSDPGGPHAVGQWVRRALPVTVSAQGPIGAEGLPAVLISESGERGPAADRAGARGAPAARSAAPRCARSARVDAAGPRDGPAFAGAPEGHRHAAQRAARLGRAARRRLAAAARAARRARRVLPRPPPARADRRRGSPGWRSPPCRCRWRGCGCALLGATGAIDAPDGPVVAGALPARDAAGSSRWPRPRSPRRSRAGCARFAARAWARGARAARPRPSNGRRGASRARRRRARGRDRRVAVRRWRRSPGCSIPTPPGCSCRPRTCGCSPPRRLAPAGGDRRA